MSITLNISKIQRFSVDDGPGIRSTVFLKGCNLRCRWCHNPENLTALPVLQYKESACIGCRSCAAVCEREAHIFSEEGHRIDRRRCAGCGKCVEVCPNRALELLGHEEKLEDLLTELMKDQDYYRVSQGGVTFSGGEPLLQAEALARTLEECKRMGLHTAVDTAGNVPFSCFEAILPYTDLLLYDIKCITPELHERFTGVPNGQILENGEKLREKGARMWVRTPVIPGFNMEETELSKIRRFVAERLKPEQHEELPYHDYGAGKYQMLGMKAETFGS